MILSALYLFIALLGCELKHDIHVSRCDINYNTGTNSGEVVVTMFLDDVEAYFSDAINLSLFNKNEAVSADSLLADYLRKHLKINHDGQDVSLFYLGKEISEDLSAGYFYLEFDIQRMPVQTIVEADMLMTLFDDQQTMLTVREDGRKVFHALQDRTETASTVDW
jgi:hypothetical protein